MPTEHSTNQAFHAPDTRQHFDVAVVLGGRIQKEGNIYVPSKIDQTDEDGLMLAGELRIDGAVGLYLRGEASTFFFTGERTSPLNEYPKYPTLVPSEAVVYAQSFRKTLREKLREQRYRDTADGLPKPTVIIEEQAYDTPSNIAAIHRRANMLSWNNVAILTNSYHTERTTEINQDYTEQKRSDDNPPLSVSVFPAESVAIVAFGDEQRDKHLRAYFSGAKSTEMRFAQEKRLRRERQGIQAWQKGHYRRKR